MKTAELIEMHFDGRLAWTQGTMTVWGTYGRHLANTIKQAAMLAVNYYSICLEHCASLLFYSDRMISALLAF